MADGISYEEVLKALGVRGKTMPDLYKYVGYSRQSSEGYKSNGYIPVKHAKRVASFFNIDLSDVMDNNIVDAISNIDKESDITHKNAIEVDIVDIKASAGGGNEIVSMDSFSTGRKAIIDVSFFKTVPSENLKCIQVDGYSMLPMLSHESWVIYREVEEFETDGLYIINYDNQLMVKMVQVNFAENKLDIISLNKEYQSYSIDKHDQTFCRIVGRVIRSIV